MRPKKKKVTLRSMYLTSSGFSETHQRGHIHLQVGTTLILSLTRKLKVLPVAFLVLVGDECVLGLGEQCPSWRPGGVPVASGCRPVAVTCPHPVRSSQDAPHLVLEVIAMSGLMREEKSSSELGTKHGAAGGEPSAGLASVLKTTGAAVEFGSWSCHGSAGQWLVPGGQSEHDPCGLRAPCSSVPSLTPVQAWVPSRGLLAIS